jgi:FkbM family methyltransferase
MTFRSRLKALVRTPLNALGFDIVRKPLESASDAPRRTGESQPRLSQWMTELDIRTVIDVGAHEGGFALKIHEMLPTARILSFEPIPECFESLRHRLAHVPHFSAVNVAVGDRDGDIQFRRSEFAPSSSLLPMAEAHKAAFPYTARHSEQSVRIARLDTLAPGLTIDPKILVKIDVQGYEDKVIRGGAELISRATLLILETSFVTLYEGQPLFGDIYDLVRSMGFKYVGSFEQMESPLNRRILQQDSLFLRE